MVNLRNVEHYVNPAEFIELMEKQIRDNAATVMNQITLRKERPSYGYTKAMIRDSFSHLEGTVGLYMVLTAQANHTKASATAEFVNDDTTDWVKRARAAMKDFRHG